MFQTLVESREISGQTFVVEADFKATSYKELFGVDAVSDNIDLNRVLSCVDVRCRIDARDVPRSDFNDAMRDALRFSAMMEEAEPPTDAYWQYPNGDIESVTIHRSKRRRKE